MPALRRRSCGFARGAFLLVPFLAGAAIGCASTPGPPPSPAESRPSPSEPRRPRPEVNRTPTVGAPAPPFTVESVTGGAPLTLVPGQVNVVVFWASWSNPDVILLSKLEPIWTKLGPRGLAIAAISIDDEPDFVARAARERGASYPVGWDRGRTATLRYRPATDPCVFIVDRSGIVRFVHEGFHDGEDAEIVAHIATLL